jgi:hypothetical protein
MFSINMSKQLVSTRVAAAGLEIGWMLIRNSSALREKTAVAERVKWYNCAGIK